MSTKWILVTCVCLFVNGYRFSKPLVDSKASKNHEAAPSIPFYPLHDPTDLDVLVKKIGNAHFVLLGEASHGTSEFQQWRANISKRLIAEKGFRCIVLEADWNEMLNVNRFISSGQKGIDSATKILGSFKRWPTWLWANEEFAAFVSWATEFNERESENKKLKIYGFDLYGSGPSIDSLRKTTTDPSLLKILDTIEVCYKPYWNDALLYSTAIHNHSANCSRLMLELIKMARMHKLKNEDDFTFVQHLQTIVDGEKYFRLLAQNQAASWNTRDHHMLETIQRLLELYGSDEKIIVWAHNSHIGDANYTDMPQRGKTNLGELMRRAYGNQQVFIVGFGMYTGDVIAAYKWGDSSHRIALPPAHTTSWDAYLHGAGDGNKIVLTEEMQKIIALNHWYDQRAIGVLYHPDRPRSSYTPSYISRTYDAFVFFDSSHAIEQIDLK